MEKAFHAAVAAAPFGVVQRLAPGIRAVLARNPSPMTWTGSITYLVGVGEVALIDPGPEDAAHHRAIAAALEPDERITDILVTHTHIDHSAGTATLARAHGARVHAMGPHGTGVSALMQRLAATGADLGGGEGADEAFSPDHRLNDGAVVTSRGRAADGGPQWALRAVETPGHLSTHLCFVLEGTGVVFTGDHVMGWATSMVSPPEGDMGAYMRSLERLRGVPATLYLPGHGGVVADPAARLDELIRHRRGREQQILAALADGPGDVAALSRRIYTDVDPRLMPAAERNVLAHLLDLLERGLVRADGQLSAQARFRL